MQGQENDTNASTAMATIALTREFMQMRDADYAHFRKTLRGLSQSQLDDMGNGLQSMFKKENQALLDRINYQESEIKSLRDQVQALQDAMRPAQGLDQAMQNLFPGAMRHLQKDGEKTQASLALHVEDTQWKLDDLTDQVQALGVRNAPPSDKAGINSPVKTATDVEQMG